MSSLAERTSNFTILQGILGSPSSYEGINFESSANSVDLNTALSLGSIADSAFHAINGVVATGSSCAIYADGTSTTGGGCTGGSVPAAISWGTDQGGVLHGASTEAGIWPTAFNSTQAGNVCHNQIGYWGITGTC
jgi:hypothetical protein